MLFRSSFTNKQSIKVDKSQTSIDDAVQGSLQTNKLYINEAVQGSFQTNKLYCGSFQTNKLHNNGYYEDSDEDELSSGDEMQVCYN